ncbi:MAG TPA: glycosyltransferase [Pyrinomonadaceae bacterium]
MSAHTQEHWPRSARPRLVHVMPWDLTVGGAQRMLDMWCSHEAERWDTHIVTVGARGPFGFKGATVHAGVSRAEVLNLVEVLRPDILVHHEPSGENGIRSECPQVWVFHCTNSLLQAPPTHAKPEVVFSNFDAEEIHPAWRELPFTVLRPQVDTEKFQPASANHDSLVCGIVGRLHEDKAPPSFIKALQSWDPGPWRVRFIGHGLDTGYQQEVRTSLAPLPWIEFSGDVLPDEMPTALQKLDAVLIATDAAQGETGSYAALEAMATGLPVIARDLSGLRFNCGDVPLYATSDAELLARIRELDDEKLRIDLGAESRRFVTAHTTRTHAATHSAGFSQALRRDVSILLPVFDTAVEYLSECWESIRAQTFREWELVLVDDGSRSLETVAEIDRIARDPRVVLIRLEKNQGIARALNIGLEQCRADLVARMDADDKMLPTRLERQFAYLREHPEVTVLGTQMQAIEWQTNLLFEPTEHPEEVTDEFIKHQRLTSEIWFLNHPTVMLRRQAAIELGGYPQYRVAQDLGLWLKVVRAGLLVHNLPTVELYYRLHPTQVSTANGVRREEYAQIVAECWTPMMLKEEELAKEA